MCGDARSVTANNCTRQGRNDERRRSRGGSQVTYPGVKCFWLEFANLAEWGLRRYTAYRKTPDVPPCPRDRGRWGYSHGALLILGQHPATCMADSDGRYVMCVDSRESQIDWPADDDPRWPTRCECGFTFRDSDPHQRWTEMLYRRDDTGQITTLRDAGPGAMWDAKWAPWKGADGRSLSAKCPNGDIWNIDSRATNCTMPTDDVHRCWVRHGEPPNITVDKNGVTCRAGAGSIQAGDYHGFLRNGEFTPG